VEEPDDFAFAPGQYVDLWVPGSDERRSFSMANTSSRDSGQLEFVIKIYPDGIFSHFLDTKLAVGDRLDVVGNPVHDVDEVVPTLANGGNERLGQRGSAGQQHVAAVVVEASAELHRRCEHCRGNSVHADSFLQTYAAASDRWTSDS